MSDFHYRDAAIDAFALEDEDDLDAKTRLIRIARAQYYAAMANYEATRELISKVDDLYVAVLSRRE
jgi:hypothetical protein